MYFYILPTISYKIATTSTIKNQILVWFANIDVLSICDDWVPPLSKKFKNIYVRTILRLRVWNQS